MDFTLFINSRDVRDHHRRIGYEYNACEAAWLVYHSREALDRDRRAGWMWIIENMPDMKWDCVDEDHPLANASVHETLKELMETECDEESLKELFEGMRFDFPVPFKEGDVVCLTCDGQPRKPIAVTGEDMSSLIDAEYYRE